MVFIFFNKTNSQKIYWIMIENISSNKMLLQLKFVFKACDLYFSLFLKEQWASWLIRTKYLEKKFSLQLFYLPIVSHLFSPKLPRATHLLKTSCFEKITVCVIETMLVMLPLVQMTKARREVNQQIKHRSR